MTPAEKAQQLAAVFRAILPGKLLRLTGDARRDLDEVAVLLEDEWVLLVGAGEGTVRLLAGLRLVSDQEAEITLKLTKGNRDAISVAWGQRGRDVGNPVVLARLLHVVIRAGRRHGLVRLVNHPVNDALRDKYAGFGFEDAGDGSGRQVLDLSEPAAVERAMRFVRGVYDEYDIQFRDPP